MNYSANDTLGQEHQHDHAFAANGTRQATLSPHQARRFQEYHSHPATIVNNTPVDNTPVDNTPVDNTPVDNTPVDNTPVNDAPKPGVAENSAPQASEPKLSQDSDSEEIIDASSDVDFGTARYYRILELTLSASQDELKSQYKRLVRKYHPDQFIDAQQKAHAEEQLKAVNEAYRVLSSRVVEGQLVKYARQAMGLVIKPESLDFGLLDRRRRQSKTFQVHFEKEIEGVDFVPSEEDSWFQVAKVSHLYGSHNASLEFEVEVDTTGLSAQSYQGWIDLYIDDAMTRLPITMRVAARPWHVLNFRRRWLLAVTFVAAVLLFTSLMAFTNFGPSSEIANNRSASTGLFAADNTYSGAVQSGLNEAGGLTLTPLYFSLLDGHGNPTIYSTYLRNNATPQLVTTGLQASGIQSRHYIAYLDERAGNVQVFLYNQATGRTEQLSTDPMPKSHLAWSADGAYLAYLVGNGTEARIGVYDVEEMTEYRLPGAITAGVSNFAWSPNGRALLFDLWRGDERRVYRMAVPDGDLQQLTQFDSWAGSWSPDGNAIIIGSATGLYRLDSRGRQLRQISTEAAERPLWSADGTWIAFLTQPLNSSKERRLWLIRPDGSSASHVANDILWHEWSPEGATLAYATGRQQTAESLYYLWITQPNGGERLLAEVNSPYFAWGR